MQTEADHRTHGAGLALFLVAMVTLAMELLCARIINIMAFYHLSFFVISLAILGMTVGALLVYVFPASFAPETALPRYSRLLSFSLPVSLACVLVIPIPPVNSQSGVVALTLVALIMSIPFTLSGILVTLTLTRLGLPYGRTYAADMFGAAAGAELFIVGLDHLKPGAFVFVLAVLATVAAAAYRRFLRKPWAGEMGVYAGLFLVLAAGDQMGTGGLVLLYAKNTVLQHDKIWYEGWNHHSWVTVTEPSTGKPFFWGRSPLAPDDPVDEAYLSIDACAGTHLTHYNGDPQSVRWLYHDVTTLAYQVQKPDTVAIIGVGGGRDALSALVADAKHVVGIDVNARTIDLLAGRANPDIGRFVNLAGNDRVTLVHDDARSYLATTSERFDVIQMSLIDTWSASAAGAYTLTENGLYTTEAWETFFDALSDRGLLTVSRWYHQDGLDETTRIVSMAVGLCLEKGLLPVNKHVILTTSGPVATLIVSKPEIGADLLEGLNKTCRERQFNVLIGPDQAPENPFFRRLVACDSRAALDAVCAEHVLDVQPPTDDRPYFFNQMRLSRAWGMLGGGVYGLLLGNLQATITLMVALAIATVGLVVGVAWPLRGVPIPKDLPVRSVRLCLLYFVSIGLGYMLIEMSFVQRFSVLLGHPSYALAIVLASMIFATGLGSLLAERLPTEQRATFVRYPVVIVLVQTAAWLLLPWAFHETIKSALPVRIAATLAFTMPCGLVMGLCFPLGILQSARLSPTLTPWMWGINGAASVVGTILAVFMSMSLGISITFLTGIFCYFLVLVVNWSLGGALQDTVESAVERVEPDLAANPLGTQP